MKTIKTIKTRRIEIKNKDLIKELKDQAKKKLEKHYTFPEYKIHLTKRKKINVNKKNAYIIGGFIKSAEEGLDRIIYKNKYRFEFVFYLYSEENILVDYSGICKITTRY